MMLYAGIRPHEVARLTWEQVDLQERAIYILPRHSFRRRSCGDIVRRFTGGVPFPMDWETKIQRFTGNEIRFADEIQPGGLDDIPADGGDDIRSCGADWASYHLSHFRSFAELQLEIGHRDATLLRTRYVDQRGVRNAHRFWETKKF